MSRWIKIDNRFYFMGISFHLTGISVSFRNIKGERIGEIKMALDRDQRTFIKNKVEKLGSLEAVKNFYKRKSLVCEFALAYAEKIYNKKKKKKKVVVSS